MHSSRIALALLLFCSGTLFAKAPAAFHYLAPDSVSIQSILSGPPSPGSTPDKADLQAVLACQQERTPRDIARARSEEDLSPAAFADVFGKWFTPEKLPLTFGLLTNAGADTEAIGSAAKKLWRRPRPPLQDPDIHPVLKVPASASYPSLHAARGILWALILAKIAPDLQDRILARGRQIGRDRVIGGVHFPTDVAAGQMLGRALAERFLASPRFQQDLKQAQAEFARLYPAAAAPAS